MSYSAALGYDREMTPSHPPDKSALSEQRKVDHEAACALIEFLCKLGDEDEAQRMAEKIEPLALASQFIFAIDAEGDEAFIAPKASFLRDDNGAFEYWDVLSPVIHLMPPGSRDTSGVGFWYFNGAFKGAAELGTYLLNAGFQWSLGAQLYVDEDIYPGADGQAMRTMKAIIEAREIGESIGEGMESKKTMRI